MASTVITDRGRPGLQVGLVSASLLRVLASIPLGSEAAVVLLLMLVGLVTHSFNMFNFPAFSLIGDEGIYAQQAWAVLREQRMTPYTYTYDHAPAGWILLAGWMAITGGPQTFGGAIPSGRVLMLLLHLGSVFFLYRLMRKLGCSVPVAALGSFFFIVSPLSILNQRLVLLDNIAVFWILLSLDQLMDGWGRLSRVALSGVFFGVAVLSKEAAIVLVPAVLFLAYQQRWQHQGRFAVFVWLVPMLMVCSWYPLYASLKGELLPAGDSSMYALSKTVAANTGQVSLLAAAWWQLTRSGGGLLNLQNEFFQLLRTEWLPRDALLLTLGAGSIALNLVRGRQDRRAMAAALLGVLPIAYFARGGAVFQHYILFALPFLCLNIAVALQRVARPVRAPGLAAVLSLGIAGGVAGGYWLTGDLEPLYAQRPSTAEKEAVVWIKQHLAPESLIIVDDSLWADLHEDGLYGPAFPHAHSHWKVAADPAVRDTVFRNDWRTVDYVVMTPGQDEIVFRPANNTVALGALQHAHLVRHWDVEGQVVMQLWKVDRPGATERKLLADAAASIATRFERAGAYVGADGGVASQSQAYALLRGVWLDDRAAFAAAWSWTQANLAQETGLLAGRWHGGEVVDAHPAADANVDTALALLLGGQRWNDPSLVEAGTRLVHAIGDHQLATVAGAPYLAAGAWHDEESIVVLNPSYFAPYAFHVFAAVDETHDWQAVITSSYQVLFEATGALLGFTQTSGLPPGWIGLTQEGELIPLTLDGEDTTAYGPDAARAFWRAGLDLRWSGDGRARAFLQQAGFLRDQVQLQGYVHAAYAHDGTPLAARPSAVSNAGTLAALLELDPEAASSLHASQVIGGASRRGDLVSWGGEADLYTQEWAWFAAALYADAMPNLWEAR